jgi:hypothetical protein
VTTLARFSLAGLGTALDLPAGVSVASVVGIGSDVDVLLEGVYVGDAEPDEVVASYEIDVAGHRRFIGFRLPEGAPAVPGAATSFTDLSTTPVDDVPPPAAEPAKKRRA